MEVKSEHGYIVLADISGYTSYLVSTELDHAQAILGELLELVVHCLTPSLTLSGLRGDAVFAYAPESRLSRGETLLELIEMTYVAFKDRLEAMKRGTTCTCAACRAMPSLDLKFITHHGNYIVHRVAGTSELVGSDVNIAHRLLKNHVGEATGWRAYALFSRQCLEHMCVMPDGMHEHVENYEHLGEIRTYSLDLQRRYTELTEGRRVHIAPEEADAVLAVAVPAPPPIVWNWLNDPQKRLQWEGVTIRPEFSPGGRTGVGARNHCLHGKDAVILTVLDWKPFDYLTVSSVEPPNDTGMLMTIRLAPLDTGTHVTCLMKFNFALPKRLMYKMMLPRFYRQKLHTLVELVSAELDALHADYPSENVAKAA